MAADTRTVTIQLQALTEHLGCVLCRGLLREAHTIPECLHSFCKSCIYRHFLVQGSRKCPKCSMDLKPRPITTLISDQKLQDVVDRIFPEFKENDLRLQAEFYAAHGFRKKQVEDDDLATAANGNNGHGSSNGVGVGISVGSSSSGSNSSSSVSRRRPAATGTAGPRKKTGSSSSALLVATGPRLITPFTVEVQPQCTADIAEPLAPMKRPFLHVDGRFKVFDLLKWVRRQLALDDDTELEVTCMGATIGPELSVQFIHRTIWQHQHEANERLVLHYRLLIP